MKKLMIVSALAATSTAALAFDYKINLESRADFVNATNKTTTTATTPVTTTEKYNNFSNGLIRLNMMGNVNDSLSYRFRYRFLASTPTLTSTTLGATLNREATTTGAVDFLYIDHKNSFFTTRFGKQNWAEAAGRETFVAGTDVFATTAALTNFKTSLGSDYRYGVTAIYKFMDTNILSLAVSNPSALFTDTSGLTAAPEKKNTGLAYGVYYSGSFMDKMIQPVLAYTTATHNGDTDIATTTSAGTNDAKHTMTAFGLRSEVVGAVIDVDYKQFKKADSNRGDNVTTTNKEQKTKSMYLNVAYPIGDFTPVLAYINDKYETANLAGGSDANYKKDSMVIAALWKPMSDVNFRYHLAYTSAVTKYDAATTVAPIRSAATNSKVDFKSITLGFKIDI